MNTSPSSTTRLTLWTTLILLILYVPVTLLFFYGFNSGLYALRWEGFSLRWYKEALGNEGMLDAMFTSLLIAALSALLAVSIAFLYALWSHRMARARTLRFTDSVMSLPLFIPEIVIAIGLLILIARGFRPAALAAGFDLSPFVSVLIGHATLAIGYAALILRARIQSYDLQQELAARDLGADGTHIFRYILLPQMMPGLAAAGCLSFAVSLDDFYVSYFLSTGGSSIQTLPLYIWSLQGRRAMTPEINVVSSILLLIAVFFFALGIVFNRQSRNSNFSEKGRPS
jgi:spermidine/putrescine transport system permease protein